MAWKYKYELRFAFLEDIGTTHASIDTITQDIA
jgi:hypothetical protein